DTRLQILSKKEDEGRQPTHAEIATITEQLNQLQNEVDHLQNNNHAPEIIDALKKGNEDLAASLKTLENHVTSLEARVQPKQYLNVSALPFSVLGIDIWNGVPKVTIKINDEAMLLSENDQCASWTLRKINFSEREAVFENKAQAFVRVQLP